MKLSYVIVVLICVLFFSLFSMFPAYSFVYPNGTVDTEYEYYGSHADILEFKMYNGENALWTALSQGKIDLTDWPLNAAWRTNPPPVGFSGDPNVVMVSAGGDAGFLTIDFNYNPHPRMGNPPGAPPNRPNPVYTVIPGYPKSKDGVPGIPPITNNMFFRLGCGHIFNRVAFNAVLGIAGVPILTPLPAYMGGWIWPGATGYELNSTKAEQDFASGNILQNMAVTPWRRYWDYDQDGVEDNGEAQACVLKHYWTTDTYSAAAGVQLNGALLAMNFTFASGSGPLTNAESYQQVDLDKDYHISLRPLFTTIREDIVSSALFDEYDIDSYWDDPNSACPNTAALNDTILNAQALAIKAAANVSAAVTAAFVFQQRFEAICAQIPLCSLNRVMAHRKWYSGGNAETLVSPDDGENIYRQKPDSSRREWLGVCNQMAYGSNSWWSLLNMHPNCSLYPSEYPGLGKMTIRYGWREQGYPQYLNVFYASSYWDSIVLSSTYDTLAYQDPYYLGQWKGDLIKNWTVGTWNDGPTTKSKCTITLRPDVKWHDGKPVTVSDVIFSLVQSGQMLLDREYAPPWWWPTGQLVRSWRMIDPYTVEILYDVFSVWVESWTLGGFYIIPRHIWQPIIESGNPTWFCPDPNVIGSGPWRYYSRIPFYNLVMVANKPGVTVKTDQTGAVPITSPGSRFWNPIHVNIHLKPPFEYRTKVEIPHAVGVAPAPHQTVDFKVSLTSWWLDASSPSAAVPLIVNKYVYIDGVLQPGFPQDKVLYPAQTDIEQFTYDFPKGNHTIKVAVHIKGPTELAPGKPNPWISQWINDSILLWWTIREDICGTKYLADYLGYPTLSFKNLVPAPDCRVDMSDIYDAAVSFGSYPGHPRWRAYADITGDYRVDMSDIYNIAKMFGKWV